MKNLVSGGLMLVLAAFSMQSASAQEVPPVPAYQGEITPVDGTVLLKLASFQQAPVTSRQKTNQLTENGWVTVTQDMEILSQARALSGGKQGLVEVQLEIVKMVNNGQRMPLDLIITIEMSELGEAHDVDVTSRSMPSLPPEIGAALKEVFGGIKGHYPEGGLRQGTVVQQSMRMSGLNISLEKTLMGQTMIGNRRALVFKTSGKDDTGLLAMEGYEVVDLENAAPHLSETLAVAKQQGMLLMTISERKEMDASGWPSN